MSPLDLPVYIYDRIKGQCLFGGNLLITHPKRFPIMENLFGRAFKIIIFLI